MNKKTISSEILYILAIIILAFAVNLMSIANIGIIDFFMRMILSGLTVTLFYKTYLYPQIYDFFVKVIAQKYQIAIKLVKTCFDCSFLVISFIISYILLWRFVMV